MIKPVRPRRAAPLSAALLVASAAAIAGCASKPENTIIDPQPDGITIQHEAGYGSMAGVFADEHCAKYGKRAVYGGTRKPDMETRLTHPNDTQTIYDCVDANAPK